MSNSLFKKKRVIGWWSGGIASALACLWAIEVFKDVRIVFQDTHNEHPDTYRFKADCEKLYGQTIEVIASERYHDPEQIWFERQTLNVATGALCSTELKRIPREKYQNLETDYAQVFGFDANEVKRIINMRRNYPEINALAPLVDMGYTKAKIVREFIKLGIEIPVPYKMGYRNNNCFKTGCVQGGIGYWQKIQTDEPEKFDRMAEREHKITDLKGEPVTICKDQSKGGGLIFLKPHPKYPQLKDLSMMKGREVEPLVECNGFCSTKD